MTPSIETRFQTIIGALEHLIIPALSGADPIVQEQAALALGHMRIIGQQLPFADTYHLVCLQEQLRTGRELLACTSGGEATHATARALKSAIDTADSRFGDDSVARDDRNLVAGAIEKLIMASSIDGDPGFLRASHDRLVEHGLRQSRRDRAWYGPTRLDPHAAELPAIPEMIAAERVRLRHKANA